MASIQPFSELLPSQLLRLCSFHFSIQLYNDSKNRHMSNKNILKPVADFIQSEARPCLLCGMQAEQRSANSD